MGIGLAVIRIALGLLLMGHGAQKLKGWFGGPGPAAAAGWFDSIGHRPGRRMVTLASASEIAGGALLVLGFLTPLAAAIVMGVMIVASAEHVRNGLWAAAGGYELPGFFAVVACGLGFAGPGRFSLDKLIGLAPWGWGWGFFATALALLAALPVLIRRRRVMTPTYPEENLLDTPTRV